VITIYKNFGNELRQIEQAMEGDWINVVNPSTQELTQLEEMGIPRDYLVYALDVDELARFERENGEKLILLRIPFFMGDSADIPYTSITQGIILTPKHIVTVCKSNNDILRDFSSGRVRNLSTGKQLRFVLRMLFSTAVSYLSNLRQITRMVDSLEDRLQQSTRNRELLELLKYQKSLTVFTTALKSNELLLRRLEQMRLFNAYPDDEELLEDVLTEMQQAIEMTNIESNILSSMMDAFASIISNNLNGIMKLLAAITILASIPSTISGFFGMNVAIPLEGHAWSFPAILGIALVLTASASLVFFKRDWL
jgi:magnesium transporter